MTLRDLETESIPSQNAGSLNEGCFSTAHCTYSCHVDMPIKLTSSPVSHLKIEMTTSRFTPCSKAPTLQTSSPDIPPDPPQQVYVRTHLDFRAQPTMDQYQQSSSNISVNICLCKPYPYWKTRYPQLMAWNRSHDECKESYAYEDKGEGGHCYKHSSSTIAKVWKPCPPTMPL